MIWIIKCTKLGIKKSSFGFLGPIPDQGIPRETSMVCFQNINLLVFEKFPWFPCWCYPDTSIFKVHLLSAYKEYVVAYCGVKILLDLSNSSALA